MPFCKVRQHIVSVQHTCAHLIKYTTSSCSAGNDYLPLLQCTCARILHMTILLTWYACQNSHANRPASASSTAAPCEHKRRQTDQRHISDGGARRFRGNFHSPASSMGCVRVRHYGTRHNFHISDGCLDPLIEHVQAQMKAREAHDLDEDGALVDASRLVLSTLHVAPAQQLQVST